MENSRRPYSRAEELALATEVEGYCPLCGVALFYEKGARKRKGYHLAHIYPLNPTNAEQRELDGVELLSSDVNHTDNLIPLCPSCHVKFDKPRSRGEYGRLFDLKKSVLTKATQRDLRSEYQLEADIHSIISRLHEFGFDQANADLVLDARKADEKFDSTLPSLVRRKIKRNIEDYYNLARLAFRELELLNPTTAELIYTQVRAFYLKQKTLGLPQPEIFRSVVDWIQAKSNADTVEAAEIVTSFFVQTCEVFE